MIYAIGDSPYDLRINPLPLAISELEEISQFPHDSAKGIFQMTILNSKYPEFNSRTTNVLRCMINACHV